MQNVLLSAKNLSKTFRIHEKEQTIYENLSLDIYEGDFTIIMGPSGAGKSTLLYSLSGMDTISGGEVTLRGEKKSLHEMSEKDMAKIRATRFGFVFQQTHLVSNLTVEENILVSGCNGAKETSLKQLKNRITELMERLHISEISDQLPGQTSGGEAQRAAIARALVNEPDLIFADEPTGALNRSNTQNILDILTKINQGGQSILMVTHDVKAAIRANRILYLLDGKISGDLSLEPYKEENARERDEQVSEWLRTLEW